MTAANPLVSQAFQIPFDQLQASHIEPAIAELLAAATADLQTLITGPGRDGPRTYVDTFSAYEQLTEPLSYAMTIIGHLESVATTPAWREAYNRVQPDVVAFFSQLYLNAELYAVLRAYTQTSEYAALTGTRRRFVDKTLEAFARRGAELGEADKRTLATLQVELSQLTTRFSQNLLDDTAAFELWFDDAEPLTGLPPSALASAQASAEAKGRAGYRLTLQAPSYIAAMTYLQDRDIRAQLWRAYNTRATTGDRDNRPLIAKILALRNKRAALLGHPTFADLVLADRMAKTGERAWTFVEDLRARVEPFFVRENAELEAFARTCAGDPTLELMPWDVGYYAEKMRQQQLDFDEEQLRPYFPVDRVIAGMFEVTTRLYGIEIRPATGYPTWDPEVHVYEVYDDTTMLGAFYVDLYPREQKRGGAWMNGLVTGTVTQDHRTPHLGLFCANVTPAVAGKPALLTHREVETLFHEFGHLLHHLLSEVEVRSLGGTDVAWDFVELPSQIMENWCWEREALDVFARHHETGEPIPDELFVRMLRVRTFRSGYQSMRQLGFASLDLSLHTRYDPERDGDIIAYARDCAQVFSPAPLPADYAMITGFNHLFAGPVGYAAGYYSYKWAEVLDADAFTRFQREGVFSQTVGQAFRREVLARGNSDEPEVLFRRFMGRDPDPEALLRRCGLAS